MTKEETWKKKIWGMEVDDSRQDVWYNGYDAGYDARDKEIAELKARVEELEEALRFYAGGRNYTNYASVRGRAKIICDSGSIARKALEDTDD